MPSDGTAPAPGPAPAAPAPAPPDLVTVFPFDGIARELAAFAAAVQATIQGQAPAPDAQLLLPQQALADIEAVEGLLAGHIRSQNLTSIVVRYTVSCKQ